MARQPEPAPTLMTAAGNINQPYRVIGMVLSVVAKEESGCGGGLPVTQAIIDATDDLQRQAAKLGGDAVIHISYMHRVSTSAGCNSTKSNFEVYAWGTAVRLQA
jgi:hypothetical protein